MIVLLLKIYRKQIAREIIVLKWHLPCFLNSFELYFLLFDRTTGYGGTFFVSRLGIFILCLSSVSRLFVLLVLFVFFINTVCQGVCSVNTQPFEKLALGIHSLQGGIVDLDLILTLGKCNEDVFSGVSSERPKVAAPPKFYFYFK